MVDSILLTFFIISFFLSIAALISIIFLQKKKIMLEERNKIPTERSIDDRRISSRRQGERRSAGRDSTDRRNGDRRMLDRRIKQGSIFDRKNIFDIFTPSFSGQSN